MGYVADQIISFVKEYLDNNINNLKYDKTVMGKVKSVSAASAVVEIGGQNVTCRIKDGISIAANDVVIVKFPNNNSSRKYIDGKLKK